ncbi:MAG: AMP-binding protein, partial [Nitrospinota bacterium]
IKDNIGYDIHDSLSVLLSTSGTTGSPKLVRLSMENIYDNANSIREYLEIKQDERAISSLPIHYSYGLSVLNSHLLAGASIVMTGKTIIYPDFWDVFNDNECSSFAGVPHSYRILDRSGFAKRSTPTLRTMTQAGGKMENNLIDKYSRNLKARGARLVVMYGQTEATARISYLPPEMLPEKLGSIGIAIPGGKLAVFDGENEITEPHRVGEIVYYGKNVMLGYATSPADLADGDLMKGKLRTGDIGYFDEDGYFFIKGRIKRFVKIYGLRINLDELEEKMKIHGPTAVTGNDEKVFVFCGYGGEADYDNYRRELAKVYKLNINTFIFKKIDSLPAKSSGKIDYKKLNEMAGISYVDSGDQSK